MGEPVYHIYRSSGLSYRCIACSVTTNTFTDNSVSYNRFGDTYQYKVRALSADLTMVSPSYSNVGVFIGDGPLEKSYSPESGVQPPAYFSLNVLPNPFNPTTTISYGLPDDSNVAITLYNIRGEVVKSIRNSYENKGIHSFEFNGERLASGIYILKNGVPVTRIRKIIHQDEADDAD